MVIERGEARVLHGGDELAGLGPGDFIGEIGAHNDEVRNATVIAKEPMTVIVLTARDFRRAVDAYPSVKSMVEAAVADRTHSLALDRDLI